MTVQMTRAEYAAKYGKPAPSTVKAAPVQMTQAQYDAKYGAPQNERGLLETIIKRPVERLLLEPARRVGEAVGSMAVNAFGTEEQKQRAAQSTQQDAKLSVPFLGDFLTRGVKPGTQGVKQVAGETLETGAMLFPYAKVAGAAGGALSKVLPASAASLAGKSAAGATAGYAADVGSKLQSDAPFGQALLPGAGAATGAVLPIAGAALKGMARLVGNTGDKIMTSVIKPTKADFDDGFSIETVKKYGLGGSLKKSVAKTDSVMDGLSRQLNEKLQSSTERLNLSDVYARTVKKSLGNKVASFGSNASMESALDGLKREIAAVAEDGSISVPEAQTLKRAAGHFGAWLYGNTDPDATARQKVYNAFYRELKEQIEVSAPAGIKDLNKQLSELIPVMNALIRRIPVAERSNAISLTDIITLTGATLHPGSLFLTAANQLSKSGSFGNLLSRTGTNAETALNGPTAVGLGNLLKRSVTPAVSQVSATKER